MGLFRGDITLSHLGFDVGIKPEGLALRLTLTVNVLSLTKCSLSHKLLIRSSRLTI